MGTYFLQDQMEMKGDEKAENETTRARPLTFLLGEYKTVRGRIIICIPEEKGFLQEGERGMA